MPFDFESERLAVFFETASKVLKRCEERDAAHYFGQIAQELRAGTIHELPIDEATVAQVLGV